MKLWVVNDIDTNYQIPLILTSFSNLSNAFHSLDMFLKFISHKDIMIIYIYKYHLEVKKKKKRMGHRGFLHFLFTNGHVTKGMNVLTSQNGSKLYVIYIISIIDIIF
jgi:hypothetical protein